MNCERKQLRVAVCHRLTHEISSCFAKMYAADEAGEACAPSSEPLITAAPRTGATQKYHAPLDWANCRDRAVHTGAGCARPHLQSSACALLRCKGSSLSRLATPPYASGGYT